MADKDTKVGPRQGGFLARIVAELEDPQINQALLEFLHSQHAKRYGVRHRLLGLIHDAFRNGRLPGGWNDMQQQNVERDLALLAKNYRPMWRDLLKALKSQPEDLAAFKAIAP